MKNKNQKFIRGLTAVLLVAGLISTAAHLRAQDQGVPDEMVYSGQLTDAYGDALNGKYYLRFILFDAPKGGSGLATQTFVRTIQDGNFSVPINGFGDALSADQPADYAMEIRVAETQGGLSQSSSAMSRRQPLRAVPYALVAGDVASVQGDLSVQGQVDGPINGSVEQVNVENELRTTNSLVVVSNLTADTLTATNIVNVGTFHMPSGRLDADTADLGGLGQGAHLLRPMGFGSYTDLADQLPTEGTKSLYCDGSVGSATNFSFIINNHPHHVNRYAFPPEFTEINPGETKWFSMDFWFRIPEHPQQSLPLISCQTVAMHGSNYDGVSVRVEPNGQIKLTGGKGRSVNAPRPVTLAHDFADNEIYYMVARVGMENIIDVSLNYYLQAKYWGPHGWSDWGHTTLLTLYDEPFEPRSYLPWRVFTDMYAWLDEDARLPTAQLKASIAHIGMWTSKLSDDSISARQANPGTKQQFSSMRVALPCQEWHSDEDYYRLHDGSDENNDLLVPRNESYSMIPLSGCYSHTLTPSEDGFYMLYSHDAHTRIKSTGVDYTLGDKGKEGDLLTIPAKAGKELKIDYRSRPEHLFFVPFETP